MSAKDLEHLEQLADELTPEERQLLIEYLGSRVGSKGPTRKRMDLRGAWAGKFPKDLDLDAALQEIRSLWHRRVEDVQGVSR